MRRQFLQQTAALAATIAAPRAFAQAGNFPDKPIKIIIGFTAGGPVDAVARVLTPKMSEILGQPVVVENRPGASTSIACNAVKSSPADGYTLLVSTGGGHATHTIDQPQYKYDPIKDFGAVAIMSRFAWVFVVHPSVPAKNLTEYIAYARANPGKLNFGSSGVGLLNHLAMERFNAAAGIKAVHVPYKETGAMVTDTLSGQIQAVFTARSVYDGHIAAGTLRALAYSGTRPGEFGPELTFASAGLPQIDDTDTINVVLGPAGMPPAVVAKLSGAIEKALTMPDVQAAITKMNQMPYYRNPADTAARMNAEYDKYLKIIRSANIKMSS